MERLATGSWLTRQRVATIAVISGAFGTAMLLVLLLTGRGTVDLFGQPVGTDFSAFWHAGQYANGGRPADAYDPRLLNAAARATHGDADFATAWHYPPLFFLVAAPLAALPYVAALILWQALSLAAIVLTLRAILPDRRSVLVALASPITPVVLAHGQNAFLTAALLGCGLLALGRRPATAGASLGALAYKPPLALTVGPLLLFTRNWTAMAFALGTLAALIAVTIALWGVGSWQAFAGSLELSRVLMEQGSVGFHKSASLFAMMRLWGTSIALSYAVQAVGLAAALWMLWRLRRADAFVLAAGACAAAALSTPYLLDYELATVGIGAAFLYAQASRSGFLPYERAALAFVWIVPWFSRPAAEVLSLPFAQAAIVTLAFLAVRRGAVTASPSRRSHEASGR